MVDWPTDNAQRVVVDPIGDREAALRRAEALDDHHADVLPRLLQRRWQERGSTDEEVQLAAQALVDLAEEPSAQAVRQPAGDCDRRRANCAALPCFSTSRSMDDQNSSSTCGTTTIVVT